jgi:hypothetical protein
MRGWAVEIYTNKQPYRRKKEIVAEKKNPTENQRYYYLITCSCKSGLNEKLGMGCLSVSHQILLEQMINILTLFIFFFNVRIFSAEIGSTLGLSTDYGELYKTPTIK